MLDVFCKQIYHLCRGNWLPETKHFSLLQEHNTNEFMLASTRRNSGLQAFKKLHTVITMGHRSVALTNDTFHDYIIAMALLELIYDDDTSLIAHNFKFGCISWEKCNDEMSSKRIRRSLVTKDTLFKNFIYSILPVPHYTTESAAACYEDTNTTNDYSPTSLDICQRYQISIDKWSSPSK
jgi:hypothetical protein